MRNYVSLPVGSAVAVEEEGKVKIARALTCTPYAGNLMLGSPSITKYRPGSWAIFAKSSANSRNVGRSSGFASQQFNINTKISSVQIRGCPKRSPFSSNSGRSLGATFS